MHVNGEKRPVGFNPVWGYSEQEIHKRQGMVIDCVGLGGKCLLVCVYVCGSREEVEWGDRPT
jgi:hypothetical protein